MSFTVLEGPFPILERPFSVLWSRDFYSCPCPGTKGQEDKEIFLSQDKGTMECPVPWKPYTKSTQKWLQKGTRNVQLIRGSFGKEILQ